ncbi:hypothetical protein [Chryseobacterium limigenitum]|uniref:Uncharacterized protein n=1 Tax=Chryseobacterium limigenitum TaxID=1612149 RepID=A0A1K2ID34_9FLAO|nr:hypothetical protein [Chryseobacterium limigenitum]SFZ90305.1 hypothetical protein SAMN05216324_101301 [Chryseobacterium limigenitum]
MTTDIGTPRDYSESKHLVYFEVYPTTIGKVKEIVQQRLGVDVLLIEQEFGITCEIPIQIIPEIIRELSIHNIAVYGVITTNLLERSNSIYNIKK